MLYIGYEKVGDEVQHLTLDPIETTPQQAADAMRAAGINPDLIFTVSATGNQPVMQLIFRKGADYQ